MAIDSMREEKLFLDLFEKEKHPTIKIKGPKENINGITVAVPNSIELIRKRFQLEPKQSHHGLITNQTSYSVEYRMHRINRRHKLEQYIEKYV